MFIHPKYKFYPANSNVNARKPTEIGKDTWWNDISTQQINDVPATEQHSEIAININSTLKAIRKFVKDNKLGIKCSGKGRTKTVILNDIQHMMQMKKISNEQDTNDEEIKDKSDEIFPIPFDSFNKCCNPSQFANRNVFEQTKLNVQWISGSTSDIKEEITAISLLLSWQNRWLFEEKNIEDQFWKCFECTRNKLEKGMFGQKCVGAIVAVYENVIIGCMMIHRFPLFVNSEEIDKYSLTNTVMDIACDEIIDSSKVNSQVKSIIESKNSYLYIESLCVAPFFTQQYEFIAGWMFDLLFRSYPNELFISSVLYENIRIWTHNHQFVPIEENVVMRCWRKNNNVAQIYRIVKVTSNRHV